MNKDLVELKREALASVRRLDRVGNNKTYWRKREAALLADLEALGAGE